MPSGGAGRARTRGGPQSPEGSPVPAFNWPPTEEDLAELQTVDVEDTTALVSDIEPIAVAQDVEATRLSRRAQALGAVILLGLASGIGAGVALLTLPRAPSGAPAAAISESTPAPGTAREAAVPRQPTRPPDVTVIAEYPSLDVDAPGSMSPGSSTAPALASRSSLGALAPGLSAPLSPPSPPPAAAPTLTVPTGPAVPVAEAVAELPPIAASPAPAPIVPARLVARSDIETLLARYRTAYEQLDVRAAVGVWPSVDADELSRAFGTLSRQELTFERCEINVVDDTAQTATADCDGEIRYVRGVGGSSWQRRSAAWTFDLTRAGDGWTIQSVTAR